MDTRWRPLNWGVLTLFLVSLALFTAGCHKEEKPEGNSTYYSGSDFSRAGSAKSAKTGGQ